MNLIILGSGFTCTETLGGGGFWAGILQRGGGGGMVQVGGNVHRPIGRMTRKKENRPNKPLTV